MQFRLSWFLVFIVILSACTKDIGNITPMLPKEKEMEPEKEKQVILPLHMNAGNFIKAFGWLNDQTILYLHEAKGEFFVSSYDIYSGHSEELFTSSVPIVQVLIHPSHEMLFFHTSPHTYVAEIFITDIKGNIVFSSEVESYELAIEWNKKDPASILITAFNEDWTYRIQHLNIDTKEISDVSHLHPFMKWYKNKSVMEQRWNENEAAFFSPLWNTSLDENADSELVLDEVYRFDIFYDYLMAITVPQEDQAVFQYQFINPLMETKITLEVPNLTQYSDWLVPYYEYNSIKNRFITFAPIYHGSADSYNEGFKLIEVNLDTFTETELLANTENKPLSCAPTRDVCLFGYQFEQLLHLKNGNTEPLVRNDQT